MLDGAIARLYQGKISVSKALSSLIIVKNAKVECKEIEWNVFSVLPNLISVSLIKMERSNPSFVSLEMWDNLFLNGGVRIIEQGWNGDQAYIYGAVISNWNNIPQSINASLFRVNILQLRNVTILNVNYPIIFELQELTEESNLNLCKILI